MPDRENISRRLERMKEDAYVSAVFNDVIDDALALLKEQEERIGMLTDQIDAITKWRANAGAFD